MPSHADAPCTRATMLDTQQQRSTYTPYVHDAHATTRRWESFVPSQHQPSALTALPPAALCRAATRDCASPRRHTHTHRTPRAAALHHPPLRCASLSLSRARRSFSRARSERHACRAPPPTPAPHMGSAQARPCGPAAPFAVRRRWLGTYGKLAPRATRLSTATRASLSLDRLPRSALGVARVRLALLRAHRHRHGGLRRVRRDLEVVRAEARL